MILVNDVTLLILGVYNPDCVELARSRPVSVCIISTCASFCTSHFIDYDFSFFCPHRLLLVEQASQPISEHHISGGALPTDRRCAYYCWLVRVSLFIELGCPRDLGKGWRGDLGTFMISRPSYQGSHWWKLAFGIG